MPPELSVLAFRRTASFEMPTGSRDLFERFRNRIGAGYPQTDLYELIVP
jgi:hypothetical protein